MKVAEIADQSLIYDNAVRRDQSLNYVTDFILRSFSGSSWISFWISIFIHPEGKCLSIFTLNIDPVDLYNSLTECELRSYLVLRLCLKGSKHFE